MGNKVKKEGEGVRRRSTGRLVDDRFPHRSIPLHNPCSEHTYHGDHTQQH